MKTNFNTTIVIEKKDDRAWERYALAPEDQVDLLDFAGLSDALYLERALVDEFQVCPMTGGELSLNPRVRVVVQTPSMECKFYFSEDSEDAIAEEFGIEEYTKDTINDLDFTYATIAGRFNLRTT